MSAEPEPIPNVCAICRATSDHERLKNWGIHHPYWLCEDRQACTDRATAQQHEAAEKVRNAVAAEKAALEADPAGKHAATGPLQAITDAGVKQMTSAARGACSDPPPESCSDAECPVHGEPEWDSEDSNAYVAEQEAREAGEAGND